MDRKSVWIAIGLCWTVSSAAICRAAEPPEQQAFSAESDTPGDDTPIELSPVEPRRLEGEEGVPIEAAPAEGLVLVAPDRATASPPELVAATCRIVEGTEIEGQSFSLLEALTRSSSEGQRLAIAQTYWDLSTAVGEFRFATAVRQFLEQVAVSRETNAAEDDVVGDALIRAAQSSADARSHDARRAVLAAQHRLAAQLALQAGEALPLPHELPHVGAYRTRFETIFVARAAPARARLIDRTLPLLRKEIDVRAAAVAAAGDALTAAEEAHALGSIDLAVVLAALDDLVEGQQAFLTAVRQYNHDIAEYAVTVAPIGTQPEALLGMLVTPKSMNAQVQPARHLEPAGGGNAVQPASGVESQGATSPGANGTSNAVSTDVSPVEQPAEANEPQDEPTPAEPELEPQAQSGGTETGDLVFVSALYPGLTNVEPHQRAARLAAALHWDRSLPQDASQPVSLADCLATTSANARRELIAAYWHARESAAYYQVYTWQAEHYAEILPQVINLRHSPTGPEAMLRLRAGHLAAEADVLLAQARLTTAQFQLTQAAGRSLQGPWLLPTTVPACGEHVVGAGVVAASLTTDAITDPVRLEAIGDQATAVVELDFARATVVDHLPDHDARLMQLPDLIAAETDSTLAFLSSLTAHNLAVRDRVLAELPANATAVSLAQALVPQSATDTPDLIPMDPALPSSGPRAF